MKIGGFVIVDRSFRAAEVTIEDWNKILVGKMSLQVRSLMIAAMVALGISVIYHPSISLAASFDVGVKEIGCDVSELMNQLDGQKFSKREQAMNGLIELGVQALEPIALHYHQASPEAAWRIKNILQTLATRSEQEETSLKAIGILMVVDDGVDSEVMEMIGKWKENRSRRAVQYLIDRGAKLDAAQLPMPRIQRQILLAEEINPFQIQPSNPLRTSKPKKTGRSNRDRDKIKQEIAKLVASSFEDVRKFVLDALPTNATDPNALLNGGNVFLRANLNGFGGISVTDGGVSLIIDQNWQGDVADLGKLAEIHDLTALKFSDQSFSDRELVFISELSNLQHLAIDDSLVSSDSLVDVELPPNVTSLGLSKRSIDRPTLNWLARQKIVRLSLNECELSPRTQQNFSRLEDLTVLEINRASLNRDVFNEWMDMTQLSQVVLSRCSFDADDYREFAKYRPRIIYFNPVSFLGVQGARDARRPGSFSCKIEMVVPESGADKAGVMAGDVVLAVNGSKIKSFTELRMFISQFDIGESMTLQVERDGEVLELEAELGDNPNIPVR